MYAVHHVIVFWLCIEAEGFYRLVLRLMLQKYKDFAFPQYFFPRNE